MDYTRLVFDRLAATGIPDSSAREGIYAQCRAEVTAAYPDEKSRAKALGQLEKAIRRQEMQARYEEAISGN